MKKEMTLDEVEEHYKGKGGDLESESIIVDNNHDKKEGFVSVWGNKADISKIIARCKKGIKSYKLVGDGVQLEIDRKCFRGLTYAFRSIK